MSFQVEDYSDQLQRIKSNEEAINAVLGENGDGSSSPSGGQSSCKESEKSQQTSPGSTVDSFYTCCTSQEQDVSDDDVSLDDTLEVTMRMSALTDTLDRGEDCYSHDSGLSVVYQPTEDFETSKEDIVAGNSGMESLISLVNKLQDTLFTLHGVQMPVEFPQIAVVGDQGAGKSSVLKGFVGRDFLPCGSGIVTRCPLILQLINSDQEYGEFLHCKWKIFVDFNEIRKEIEAETKRLAGINTGISYLAIHLRIYSRHVLNLTLIDLPGMTKTPVGDQPPDIEMQIKSLLLQFIMKPNCIILAVTPAHIHLDDSNALKFAKEVDPEGLRTIGVITKLDLMDEETDARELLKNELLPLRRGYVGVVNRSQRDFQNRKGIRAAMAAEREFFLSHPAYGHMADRMGTTYLQRVLNEELREHYDKTLLRVRDQLQEQILDMEKAMEPFRAIQSKDHKIRTRTFIQMIQQLQSDVEGAIKCRHSGSAIINATELSSGAKINRIFHKRFPSEIAKIQFDKKELRSEISYAIRNIQGIRVGLFTPDLAFETIVKDQISRLKEPSLQCIDLVLDVFTDCIDLCIGNMSSYPRLQREVKRIVSSQILERAQLCKNQVALLIESETAYINTNHPDFIKVPSAQQSAVEAGGKLDNQVIHRGYMTISNLCILRGVLRNYWFVLTPETLTWYKDEKEEDKMYVLSLNGLQLRNIKQAFVSRRIAIALYNPDRPNVYKDYKQLELSFKTLKDMGEWKSAFLRAGVNAKKVSPTAFGKHTVLESSASMEPELKRQVETIRNLVDSYMKIVMKTAKDLVPKTIMNLMIDSAMNFIKGGLLADLYAIGDPANLMVDIMGVDPEREEFSRIYHAYKEALGTIYELLSTASSPVLYNATLPPSPMNATTSSSSLSSSDVLTPPPSFVSADYQPIRRDPENAFMNASKSGPKFQSGNEWDEINLG